MYFYGFFLVFTFINAKRIWQVRSEYVPKVLITSPSSLL